MAATPVFLPGESHGQRSLAGYSPWAHKELDTTERLTVLLSCLLNFSWYTFSEVKLIDFPLPTFIEVKFWRICYYHWVSFLAMLLFLKNHDSYSFVFRLYLFLVVGLLTTFDLFIWEIINSNVQEYYGGKDQETIQSFSKCVGRLRRLRRQTLS